MFPDDLLSLHFEDVLVKTDEQRIVETMSKILMLFVKISTFDHKQQICPYQGPKFKLHIFVCLTLSKVSLYQKLPHTQFRCEISSFRGDPVILNLA